MVTTTLHQLRIFALASKLMNLTEVARALHVTPSSISHAIEKLELALRVSLVKKIRSGIELTEAGEALYRGIETTPVSQLTELFVRVAAIGAPARSEVLSISASRSPSPRAAPPLLATGIRR
jgi:DNA-binding transcriptional LysR family regulator